MRKKGGNFGKGEQEIGGGGVSCGGWAMVGKMGEGLVEGLSGRGEGGLWPWEGV